MTTTEGRTAVADALAGLGIPVHPYPPGTVTPPAIVLDWGSPPLEPSTLRRTIVGVDVRIFVSAAAATAAHERLADLLDAAYTALAAAGIRVGTIPAPTPNDDDRTLVAVLPALVTTGC